MIERRCDAVVTAVRASFSLEDARLLKSHIANHLAAGLVNHVIDLSAEGDIPPRLLNALLRISRTTHRAHGLFALVTSRPEVLRTLAIAGLDGVFPIFSDVALAVRTLEACARERGDCVWRFRDS